MAEVRITATFEPEDPDPDDETGMTEDEYESLTDDLQDLGLMNIVVTKT